MCVRLSPLAMSVTASLMVFVFRTSFHLPLLARSHTRTLCQACQHVTFTGTCEKDSGLQCVCLCGFAIIFIKLFVL